MNEHVRLIERLRAYARLHTPPGYPKERHITWEAANALEARNPKVRKDQTRAMQEIDGALPTPLGYCGGFER